MKATGPSGKLVAIGIDLAGVERRLERRERVLQGHRLRGADSPRLIEEPLNPEA
jgi:hypothetical protein